MKITSSLKHYAGAMLLASLFSPIGYSQVSFTGNYSQNFDGLSNATVTNVFANSTFTQYAIPSTNNSTTGWSGARIFLNGTAATSLVADNGNGNSGAIYSYGTTSTTDRALGMLASGSNAFAVGAAFTNTSNATITSLTITYTGEFWRSSTSVQNVLTFGYGFSGGTANATNYLSDTSLSALSGLDLVGPAPVASNGLLNGNLSGNQTVFTSTIKGIEWAPGSSLYIRWSDVNDLGNDAGLAIDNFSMTGVLFTGKYVPIGGTTNFSQNDFGGNLTFTNLDNAVFNSTGTTVTLSGNVTADGLKFSTDGYTLSGGSGNVLTLTAGSVSTQTGVNASITAVLAGSNGLSKAGPGTLTLSGNNTFVGDVGIIAGRLNISSEINLGAPSNGVTLGGTLATTGSLSLGSGRTLSGSGVIETGASQSLTLAGNVSATSVTVNGANSLAFNGASNSIGSLILTQPSTISVGGGALAVTSNLTLSGTTTLSGPINFGSAAPTVSTTSGTFTPSGNLSFASRITKTGLGTLDLTTSTINGTGNATGFRLGIQSSSPAEGGTLKINSAAALGASQFQLNSGTLDVAAPLSLSIGVSIGGRYSDSTLIAPAVFSGNPISFSGVSGFFPNGLSGKLGFQTNNVTTLSGNFTTTVNPTSGVPGVTDPSPTTTYKNVWGGSGTLVVSGNASALLDDIWIADTLTLKLDGTLGGNSLKAFSGSTISGNGTFAGYHIFPSGTGNSTINEKYLATTATFDSGSTLAPSGALKFRSNLNLDPGSNTILDITGPVIGSGYDSVDVSLPGGNSTITGYVLTTNGSLALNVAAPASSGNYTLFTTGAGVSRAGSFSSVTLTGGYSGSLAGNATTTSGNRTFAFEQSTGVLTVANSAPPVSSNAELSALSLSGASLSPSFAAGTISYTATVANSVTSLTVTPTVAQGNATVTVNGTAVASGAASGSISLSVGSNVLTTVVTAQDGVTTKSYTVTVTRSLSALESWRSSTFSGTAAAGSTATTGLGANAADFDGDGVVNLLEYATGTDATAVNASPVTVSQVGNFLTLSYPVIADSNLTYTVQGTNDLTTAFTTAAGATTGTTVKTYTDTVDLSAAGARRFLRLQVTSTVTP